MDKKQIYELITKNRSNLKLIGFLTDLLSDNTDLLEKVKKLCLYIDNETDYIVKYQRLKAVFYLERPHYYYEVECDTSEISDFFDEMNRDALVKENHKWIIAALKFITDYEVSKCYIEDIEGCDFVETYSEDISEPIDTIAECIYMVLKIIDVTHINELIETICLKESSYGEELYQKLLDLNGNKK